MLDAYPHNIYKIHTSGMNSREREAASTQKIDLTALKKVEVNMQNQNPYNNLRSKQKPELEH